MSAKLRGRAFLLLALISGFGAVLLTRELVRRAAQTPAPVVAAPVIETQPVLVARTNLAAGESLAANQLNVVAWPREFLPVGYQSDAGALVGRVLRRPVQKDEPISESALATSGADAGLGSLISSERRAMAVKVDPVVIVAGFVKPGSRVDVIATVRTDRAELPFTGLILQDLKVLAIDQKLEETAGKNGPELGTVVTLEVTPPEAQKLAYAAKEGSLQLVLRNPLDVRRTNLRGITGKDVIPEPGPRRGESGSIESIRGARIQQESL